ncbi:MAG: glutathione S-transferase N-terminal domain-containing protein [Porticoccaceae bacterium]|jgi:GST-like protein|nr:glutathione S-transferase N-terminal domain-containing protein [Porticoccaceae bacterium]
MLDIYYWPTPNGHKITIFVEEAGLDYKLIPVNISAGEQFAADFLAISPNNKIPALVDHQGLGTNKPLAIFESGAILQYLAEKTGRFLPTAADEKYAVLQWLCWQIAHLGPMLGQNHHFRNYAPEKIDYAITRFLKETERLYGVLDDHLENRGFIAGDYSIADMACYPWILPEHQGMDLEDFPNLKRWKTAIGQRPAVIRAYALEEDIKKEAVVTDESRTVLFNQGRRKKSGVTP